MISVSVIERKMHVQVAIRNVGLCLLITAVVNSKRTMEPEFRSTPTWPAEHINAVCVVVQDSLDIVSCDQKLVIHVINAHYGYNKEIGKSCSNQQGDCLLSVPLNSSSYYKQILEGCNNKERCDSSLKAKSFNKKTSCGRSNDYVSIQFHCLSSEESIETVSLCSTPFGQGTINCTGVGVIHIVGAILGFQPDGSECRPGEDRCRIQPDLDHLSCIRSSCQGMQECQFYTATSANRENHTCNHLTYIYENITYYCTQDSGSPDTRSSACKHTSTAVTSVVYNSLSTSEITLADTSTNMMIDNLGNMSTITTDETSTQDIAPIILGVIVGLAALLIVLLLLLIFIFWRKRNLKDTSTATRGDVSDHGMNGFSQRDEATLVQRNTPQNVTQMTQIYGVSDTYSSSMTIPSPSNLSNTAIIYGLEQDTPDTHVYSLALEPRTAREPSDNYYSEVEDLSIYSLAQKPYTEIENPKAAIYVNVANPRKPVYSQEQSANASTYPKIEDPTCSLYSQVEKSGLANVKIDPEGQNPQRNRFVDGSQDLILIDNSLYFSTET